MIYMLFFQAPMLMEVKEKGSEGFPESLLSGNHSSQDAFSLMTVGPRLP